ncbi:MAG: efflux RND transporter periplasmic adaptor subunit [Lentisphaeria bacterium]
MKKIIIPVLTTFAVVLLLGGSIYGMIIVQKKHNEAQKSKAGRRDTVVSVQTGRVGRDRIDEILTFNGDIEAMQSVDIKPKIAGRLNSLAIAGERLVSEGTRVKKGQLIATLDDREWAAQLANARAALAAAKASLTASRADVLNSQAGLLNAKANTDQQRAALLSASAAVASARAARTDKEREQARQKNLLDQQATTQQNYDQAQTAADQARAEFDKAEAAEKAAEAQIRSAEAAIQQAEAAIERSKASVQQAEAALQQIEAKLHEAEINLSETKLYAPMDGVVSKKYVDPGAMVSSTTAIITIMAIDEVKVILSVPVNHLPRVTAGKTKARLRTVSLPSSIIDCTISKIYPAIDLTTRTAQVEIVLDNAPDESGNYRLKPGMYATVDMLIESRENVLAIDPSLPIRNLEKRIVYVVEGDKVRAVDTKLGIHFANKVEVRSGLQEGDEIVVVGQHRLTDGASIRRLEGNNLSLDSDK